MSEFKLSTEYKPQGDQPQAIEKLIKGIASGLKYQTLLGVTGSGKTFTMANIIAAFDKPALVLAHNKTLAAQLFREFKELFPVNAVEYFVSYYDYYQPEAYIPESDMFIEKDASIDDQLDKMRLAATTSIMTRRDVIIVSSVSCIYGIGSPEDYRDMVVFIRVGDKINRQELLKNLVQIQYVRNDLDFFRGTFRVRGDIVDIYPAYEDKKGVRIEIFGDEIESISEIEPLTGKKLRQVKMASIYPATHWVAKPHSLQKAIKTIKEELKERLDNLTKMNKLVEAQRLEMRTMYDLERLQEMGVCNGIENYSRHLSGRAAGEPPFCLLNYFPKDYLLFIDESHITTPQVRGMYFGDRSRKETLIEFGFRLPSALDNRPLNFDEFEKQHNQVVFVSATPADYEITKSEGEIVEQIIRPTGLTDPQIIVKPASNQVEDLIGEIRKRTDNNQRVLVTTLTKRMAEDLTEYYKELGIKAKYLHSDIETIERTEILRDLRLGEFDVLVGINLLREGLDLPEVSLVAVLDADKEGFLRSETSLIQTCGRAARNVDGTVILYADIITKSIKKTIDETNRRRAVQEEYNKENGITPQSIKKEIKNILDSIYEKDYITVEAETVSEEEAKYRNPQKLKERINELRKKMLEAAKKLEFEQASVYRDQLLKLEQKLIEFGIESDLKKIK